MRRQRTPAMDKNILLVEDNPDDAELTRIAFAQAGLDYRLEVVRDGAQALDYLFARGAYANRRDAELPAVVLLDLNLPKLGGREVLQAIRTHETTRTLPVVVLTTSNERFDIDACYALGANRYIRKPVDFEQFVLAVKQIGLYWLVLNKPEPL